VKLEGQAEEKCSISAPSQENLQLITCQIPSITGHRWMGNLASLIPLHMDQLTSLYTHNNKKRVFPILVKH